MKPCWHQSVDFRLLITVMPLTMQHISFTPEILWNNSEPESGLNLRESTGKESSYSFLLTGKHDMTFWNWDHQNRIEVKTVSCKNILNNINSANVSAFTVFLSMAIARPTRHVKIISLSGEQHIAAFHLEESSIQLYVSRLTGSEKLQKSLYPHYFSFLGYK